MKWLPRWVVAPLVAIYLRSTEIGAVVTATRGYDATSTSRVLRGNRIGRRGVGSESNSFQSSLRLVSMRRHPLLEHEVDYRYLYLYMEFL